MGKGNARSPGVFPAGLPMPLRDGPMVRFNRSENGPAASAGKTTFECSETTTPPRTKYVTDRCCFSQTPFADRSANAVRRLNEGWRDDGVAFGTGKTRSGTTLGDSALRVLTDPDFDAVPDVSEEDVRIADGERHGRRSVRLGSEHTLSADGSMRSYSRTSASISSMSSHSATASNTASLSVRSSSAEYRWWRSSPRFPIALRHPSLERSSSAAVTSSTPSPNAVTTRF